MKRAGWLALMMAVLLVVSFSVIGCGTDNGDETADSDVEETENGADVLEGFLNPLDISEMIDSFNELEYSMIAAGFDTDIHYIFEEMDNVDGVEASRITFGSYTAWVDAEGEFINAEHKTLDHLTGEDGIAAVEGMQQRAFFTFKEIANEEIEVERAVRRGSLVKTDTVDFGGITGTVNVYSHSFDYKGERVSGEISIADFGDFKMAVKIELDNDFLFEIYTIELS